MTSNATSKGITPSSSLIRAHAPDQNPPTDSGSPRQWVFAGCCQSLLGGGPSRRYLCIPCVGAWTHTPGCHLCAQTRFFQRCNGHRPRCKELGPSNYPRKAASTGCPISRLQSFTHVQAPTLARPPGCSHRRIPSWATGPFTPRRTRLVTCPRQRHRYMPDTGNWHGRTLTSWNAALSAAPAPTGQQTKFHGGIASSDSNRPALPGRTGNSSCVLGDHSPTAARPVMCAGSTGRRNTCVNPLCWGFAPPVRGQLVTRTNDEGPPNARPVAFSSPTGFQRSHN